MTIENDPLVKQYVEAAVHLTPEQRELAARQLKQSANEARDVVEDEQEAV